MCDASRFSCQDHAVLTQRKVVVTHGPSVPMTIYASIEKAVLPNPRTHVTSTLDHISAARDDIVPVLLKSARGDSHGPPRFPVSSAEWFRASQCHTLAIGPIEDDRAANSGTDNLQFLFPIRASVRILD